MIAAVLSGLCVALAASDRGPAHGAAIPPAPTLDAPIRANFCGMRDSRGEVMFTIFVADLPIERRMEWYKRQRDAGLTHFVLAAQGGYRGKHEFDWTGQPDALAALIREVLAQGFRPIFFLSSGDAGTGDAADRYFGALLDGLGSLADECHLVPGWEVVRGGWTSKQFYHAVEVISRHVKPTTPIWYHGSDDRSTFASYPLEADDPTRGDAPGAWRTPMGKRLAGLLYQSESGHPLLRADEEPPNSRGLRGWRWRATEVLMRLQDGRRGWPARRVVAFELGAEDYFAGRAMDADIVRLADEAASLGFKEFGNGIPSAR